jgi:hypothetical protein
MGIWQLLGVLPILLLVTLFGAVAYNSARGWRSHKLVPREFYVGFDPLSADAYRNQIGLSEITSDLLGDHPVFVAIKGRPAGLINFLREYINLPRRFEFALCDKHAVTRRASLTGHFIQSSKMMDLHSITVNQTKINPLIVIFMWWLTLNGFGLFLMFMVELMGFYDLMSEAFVLFATFLITVFFVVYYFKSRIIWVSLMHGTDGVTTFGLCPAILDRMFGIDQRDMPLDDANAIAKIFTALKDVQPR